MSKLVVCKRCGKDLKYGWKCSARPNLSCVAYTKYIEGKP
jgi:hypothetical protein